MVDCIVLKYMPINGYQKSLQFDWQCKPSLLPPLR